MLADYSSSHKLSYYATLPRRFSEIFSRVCTCFRPNVVQNPSTISACCSSKQRLEQ
ncbi:hypothetical protein HMPREF1572_01067 [Gardnerella vaginalis JCP7275]|nr:hypothetical protein HMPREF1572_01067 [Gardnerella vaginalis JCP7275]